MIDTASISLSDPNSIAYDLFHLFIAVSIGILIGLERQFSHRDEQKFSLGGIRTFALVSVFGFLCGELGTSFPFMPVVGLLSISVFLTFSHYVLMHKGRRGITTEIALFIAFLLGLMVHSDQLVFAVAIALSVSILMSIKPKIESIVEQITEDELFAVFKFLVVTVLVMPLLPNYAINTFGISVINPREVWTVMVLVLSLSFIGYILIKFWGPSRGIMLTGFLGGFVSSTVVTWVFSKRSREDEGNSHAYALATLLAVSIMFLRIEILAEIINSAVGARLLLPLTLMLLTGLTTVTIIRRRYGVMKAASGSAAAALGNPFNLSDAIKFGLLYSVIIVVIKIANDRFGNAGVYAVSAISGFANVDAIVISMARLARAGAEQVAEITALNAILLAAHSNNLVKLAISLFQGSRTYKLTMTAGIGAILLVTAVWALAVSW